jgi:hypothetical protein
MFYPRKISSKEKELLDWLLPQNIPAYLPYNNFFNSSDIIGVGRWGEGNLLFDKKPSKIDLTLGMPPVIAYGECKFNNIPVSLSVHDFNIDDQLEVQFSGIFPIPDTEIENKWCYSYWKPGDLCPATKTPVKEISLKNMSNKDLYVLSISPTKKVLWLHHILSGFNQLIPITAFYDELLRTKHIRDAKLISRPATFFEYVEEFSDNEYRKALLEYNKKASRKFDASEIINETSEKKKTIFQKIFGK